MAEPNVTPLDNGTMVPPALGARLRAERERIGIGVRELARQVNVSASMISMIERDRVMPSVHTLYLMTSVLGVSLDELFGSTPDDTGRAGGPPPAHGSGPVKRSAQRSLKLASGVQWDLLTTEPGTDVEFLRATYAVGGESASADALMRHGGYEYGTVISGTLGVTVGFETHTLEAGDSISFDSTTPHRLFNAGDETTVAIWVVVARSGDPRAPGR